ncbi:hypothetical protein MO867_17275 [Microbulbifer sp. OS29]|uniref:Uncharacterized protein n=1 Tax=Microbulbifer okhotskensis TaxID=2926617 RepID=A0A9X2EQT4_9GAMM|nr:hypothetical protein [Microbulbifer okhotskensis]MCO1336085.1 hypothetical protein [Microbulbifer okhotskensis]
MPDSVVVNSANTLQGFLVRAESLFKQHKHLRFSWRIGRDRSLEQNRMFFELYQRIGHQLYGNDTDLARAECKLTIGVPILLLGDKDPEFTEVYNRYLRGYKFSYEDKLQIVRLLTVTSRMTVKQGQEYIDSILNQYTLKGVDFGPLNDFGCN